VNSPLGDSGAALASFMRQQQPRSLRLAAVSAIAALSEVFSLDLYHYCNEFLSKF
jgi:hypothetical protein